MDQSRHRQVPYRFYPARRHRRNYPGRHDYAAKEARRQALLFSAILRVDLARFSLDASGPSRLKCVDYYAGPPGSIGPHDTEQT